ncbi:glycosyltransferase family 2 protein [Flavobacterium faecale]|uniref:glycosyltransferase family 2 protein n=1 Tax=Flavobacterium faecale TaxID=1355330 RepID=UPI003AAC9720
MKNKNFNECFIRIVILNYNESKYTISLIDQLRNQTFLNWEIVVVDNCSREDQVVLLKENLPSDVFAIFSEENLGYAKGNNLGLKYSGINEIDYFLVLNNDLIIEDEKFIEELIKGMIAYERDNVVASSPIVNTVSTKIPLEDQIQVRRVLSLRSTFLINIPLFKLFTKNIESKFLYKKNMPFLNKYMKCDSINGAAFIIESEFIKSNNYLDDGTFLYYEEIILGKQIKNAGNTCLLNGFTFVDHLQGISTKSSTNNISVKMERLKYKSSLYYLKKYENMNTISCFLYSFLSEITIFIKVLINKFK